MSCLQRQSATAHIHPSFPQCRYARSLVPSALGWPSAAIQATAACDHGVVLFGWMLYLFRLLSVCSHCSCHIEARASAGLHRRGWDVEMNLFRECRRLFTGCWWWRLCRWSVKPAAHELPRLRYRSVAAGGAAHVSQPSIPAHSEQARNQPPLFTNPPSKNTNPP